MSREQAKNGIIKRCLRIFDRSSRNRLFLSLFGQILLNLLDLVGVATIGLIGALSVRGIQSGPNPQSVQRILQTLGLQDFTFQRQIAALAIFATAVLILKTIISVFLLKKIFRFMSSQAARISARLFANILSKSVTYIEETTSQSILYSVTAGVSKITMGVVGNLVTLISDGALLILMFLALLFVNVGMTISIGCFFGIAIGIFHIYVRKKAEKLGFRESNLNILSNSVVLEGLNTYRERYTRRTLGGVAEEFHRVRIDLSKTLAEATFLPNITKYVVETLVLIGALLISGVQFAVNDAGHAIATLSVFLGAATRVTPAIMRMQQSLIQIRNSAGAADSTLRIIEDLENERGNNSLNRVQTTEIAGVAFELKNVNFRYPKSPEFALKNISITIPEGEYVAIVGPSGGGKSTLADILLGLKEPQNGIVKINGGFPNMKKIEGPSNISYVPQISSLITGSLRENLLLGLESNSFSDESLYQLLKDVGLAAEFEKLGIDLSTNFGDRGLKLSGGQLQRIGIARALITEPKILLLDEATSALDANSENQISIVLEKMRNRVTLIVIAHRLSTIRNADKIYYLDHGSIVSSGTFDELRKAVPDFENQASLMGL